MGILVWHLGLAPDVLIWRLASGVSAVCDVLSKECAETEPVAFRPAMAVDVCWTPDESGESVLSYCHREPARHVQGHAASGEIKAGLPMAFADVTSVAVNAEAGNSEACASGRLDSDAGGLDADDSRAGGADGDEPDDTDAEANDTAAIDVEPDDAEPDDVEPDDAGPDDPEPDDGDGNDATGAIADAGDRVESASGS